MSKSIRWIAKLDDLLQLKKIRDCKSQRDKTEFLEHLVHVRGVLRSRAHQNIDVAGVARHAMKSQGKRANNQIINVMRV